MGALWQLVSDKSVIFWRGRRRTSQADQALKDCAEVVDTDCDPQIDKLLISEQTPVKLLRLQMTFYVKELQGISDIIAIPRFW